MKNIFTKFKLACSVAACFLIQNVSSQTLGLYEFTGTTCLVPVLGVTTQPANAVFAPYTYNGGITCGSAGGVVSAAGWSLGTTTDLTKFFEFSITPNSCVTMNLDSIKFLHRTSASAGTAVTVSVRSSLDGYAADIYFAVMPSPGNFNYNVAFALTPAGFNSLSTAVTFRVYTTNILAVTATYRNDNVAIIGTAVLNALANYYIDSDGDGFGNIATFVNTCTPPAGYVANSTDCNDADALIGAGITYFQDSDGDSFGNPMMTQVACTAPVGYVTNSSDCNDGNAAITLPTLLFYLDADNDGFGGLNDTITCAAPVGYVTNSDDCNDNNAAITIASVTYYQDLDNDSFGNTAVSILACTAPFGYVILNGDCNDNLNTIYPGAVETCDGIDNDCDGTVDDNVVILTWYQDADGDTYGNALVSQALCSQPMGYVLNGSDCDDASATITIATTTFYQDTDGDGFGGLNDTIACSAPVGYVLNNTDCNDGLASITTASTFYRDFDGDSFGGLIDSVACSIPVGYVVNNLDCNDNNATAFPGGIEIADNGIDEDCNGSDLSNIAPTLGLYEFTGIAVCPITATSVTAQPVGATFGTYSNTGGTCSVTANVFSNSAWNTTSTIDLAEYNEFTVTPDACKSLDLRNLLFTHKNSASGGTPTILVRSSLDNYTANLGSFLMGAPNVLQTDNVVLPAAFAAITSPITFRFYVNGILAAGATYRQDDVTLKGFINTVAPSTFYVDADGDGFGGTNDTLICGLAPGFSLTSTDCNDADSLINPNTVWHQDSDADGFGSSTVTLTQCAQPVGYVLTANDCNDALATVTVPTTFYLDLDGDGFGGQNDTLACAGGPGLSSVNTDCNDNNPAITTQLNTYYLDTDNDGFGTTTTTQACTQPIGYALNPLDCNDNNAAITLGTRFYLDTDGDGFGGAGASIISCTLPVGYAADSTDCNNTNPAVNPNATEIASNGIDDNCDGIFAMAGLNEANVFNVNVYPNPGKNELTISFENAVLATMSVEILSADGKIVYASSISDSSVINTSNFENGLYFVTLSNGNANSTVRWIKM